MRGTAKTKSRLTAAALGLAAMVALQGCKDPTPITPCVDGVAAIARTADVAPPNCM